MVTAKIYLEFLWEEKVWYTTCDQNAFCLISWHGVLMMAIITIAYSCYLVQLDQWTLNLKIVLHVLTCYFSQSFYPNFAVSVRKVGSFEYTGVVISSIFSYCMSITSKLHERIWVTPVSLLKFWFVTKLWYFLKTERKKEICMFSICMLLHKLSCVEILLSVQGNISPKKYLSAIIYA